MSWPAEVWHVMWKDVREQRWLLASYYALIVIATLHLGGWYAKSAGILELSQLWVPLLGILVTMALVLGDSPMRPVAFWAGKPFRPTAVLGAKALAVVTLVLAPPALAQGYLLHALGMARQDIPGTVWRGVVTVTYMLVAGAFIAGVSRNLRVAISGLLLTLLLMQLGGAISGAASVTLPLLLHHLYLAVLTAALGWLVARLYLQRGWRTVTMLAWFAGLMIATNLASPSTAVAGVSVPSSERVVVRIVGREVDNGRTSEDITLAVDNAPALQRVSLGKAHVVYWLADRSVMDVPLPAGTSYGLADADSMVPVGIHTLHRKDAVYGVMHPAIVVELSRAQAERLRLHPPDSLALRGTVTTFMSTWDGTIPVTGGALVRGANRTTVTSFRHADGQAWLAVKSSRLENADNADPRTRSTVQTEWYLVNDDSHDVARLSVGSGSGGGYGLLIPGPSRFVGEELLHTEQGDWVRRRTDAWFEHSRLVSIRVQPLAEYPLRAVAATSAITTVRR